jgi:hypothetical protein
MAGITPGTGSGGPGRECAGLVMATLAGTVGVSSPAETTSVLGRDRQHAGRCTQAPAGAGRKPLPAALTRSNESRCTRSASAPGAVMR